MPNSAIQVKANRVNRPLDNPRITSENIHRVSPMISESRLSSILSLIILYRTVPTALHGAASLTGCISTCGSSDALLARNQIQGMHREID